VRAAALGALSATTESADAAALLARFTA
jgi:hypothetical protein